MSGAPEAALGGDRLAGRRAALAAARARTALQNRRGAWRLSGLAADGRAAGRAAGGLPDLGAAFDPCDPAVAALVDPAQGQRVRSAAAAVLAGHQLALAITPDARAEARALVADEAQAFALARRHLALPPETLPLAETLGAAERRIDAAWRRRLPAVLAAEWPGGGDAPAADTAPPAAPSPARGPRGLRLPWSRRHTPLPPDPAAVPPAERPDLALDAALAACALPSAEAPA
ncbi:hypothetical protein [Paracoccus sanguinis]|uniref:Uncharacterized protein n=1 Tax=Paracoccus sanguinis TaxID=1545044 RepID=A0A1H3AKW2_9RHOB|nr:hypothetical protein [Paracoccus sanguinis]SDX30245.1 hypothetical protein SAMN05444276_104117 [Paracoccus sanguinis]